jgi:hypothetical protein
MAQPLNTSCSNDKSLIHLDPIIIHWDSTWIHKVLRQQLNRARNGFIASSSQGDPATTSTWPCWSQHLKRNRPNHGTAMWPSPNQSDRWIQCGSFFRISVPLSQMSQLGPSSLYKVGQMWLAMMCAMYDQLLLQGSRVDQSKKPLPSFKTCHSELNHHKSPYMGCINHPETVGLLLALPH